MFPSQLRNIFKIETSIPIILVNPTFRNLTALRPFTKLRKRDTFKYVYYLKNKTVESKLLFSDHPVNIPRITRYLIIIKVRRLKDAGKRLKTHYNQAQYEVYEIIRTMKNAW